MHFYFLLRVEKIQCNQEKLIPILKIAIKAKSIFYFPFLSCGNVFSTFSTCSAKIRNQWHSLYMSSSQQQPCDRGDWWHNSMQPCLWRICWGLFSLILGFTNTHSSVTIEKHFRTLSPSMEKIRSSPNVEPSVPKFCSTFIVHTPGHSLC